MPIIMTKAIIANINPSIVNASNRFLENARINPAIVINGAGSSISTIMENATCICVTSLVLRVMREAAPNRLKSLIENSCAFRNKAPLISFPMLVDIAVDV